MDFGKVDDPGSVDFALPPLTGRSEAVLGGKARGDGTWLRVGTPAWSKAEWVGKLYPKGTPQKRFLATYAARCGAVELNASYHHVPSEKTLDGWAADTPADFRFCPKVHQSITHEHGLRDVDSQIAAFAARLQRLGPRLGPALLQLPPRFAPKDLPLLDAFLAAVPEGFRVAVELRHPKWFDQGALIDAACDVFERRRASAVITDVAGRRDVSHGSLTAPFAFVRFVGNDLHPTDVPRADAWVDRLIDWREKGLEEAYFFVHQTDDLLAPETLVHVVNRARAKGVALPPFELVTGRPAAEA